MTDRAAKMKFVTLLVLCSAVNSGSLSALHEPDNKLPNFATIGKTLRIATLDTVVLPCEVINLGKYVLAWKRGNAILTAGSTKVSPDERIRLLDGYNLEIRDVQTNDAGDYICHIATLQPKEITHTLEVLVPPRIQRFKNGNSVEVRKGTQITLSCEASGNPVPSIMWSRKNNLLPSGEKSVAGSSYTIEQVNRHHSGTYICTASNGVGKPASEQLNLVVNYPPEIEVERSWVHSGEGYEAQLVCIVHAEPTAEVLWYRNTLRLDVTERRIMENRGSRHTLLIRKVQPSDFGNYSCVADNQIGKSRQYLTLSGKPHPAVFQSKPSGLYRDSYNLTWVVNSYSPIEEYKLSYRSVSEPSIPHYSFSNSKFDVKSTRKEEPMYAPEYEVASRRWKNVTLTAPAPTDQFSQAMSYLIQDLEPATPYEAIVLAKNRFGWSDPSDAFKFSTKGAETNHDVSNDVYAETNHDVSNDVYAEPEMRDLGVKYNIANHLFVDKFVNQFAFCTTIAVMATYYL